MEKERQMSPPFSPRYLSQSTHPSYCQRGPEYRNSLKLCCQLVSALVSG